ncbi:hypothetical protein LQW54_000109 [Pestalotiopsis sp. IQ-011]
MSQDSSPGEDHGLKIINTSLFRMGTNVMDSPWSQIEAAAEGTWPDVPGGPSPARPPFEREDWDALWGGSYDAVTDLASPFAPALVSAYPDARVVVVQRDFASWWPTFRSQVRDKVMLEPNSSFHAFITSTFLGIRPVHAMRKVLLGFFGVRSRAEIDEECARVAYDAYFREIRARVPPGRRLEYKLGSGWEPLCAFLGVDVPDVDFPNANEKEENAKESRGRERTFVVKSMQVTAPWMLAAGVAWVWICSTAVVRNAISDVDWGFVGQGFLYLRERFAYM